MIRPLEAAVAEFALSLLAASFVLCWLATVEMAEDVDGIDDDAEWCAVWRSHTGAA